MIITQNRLEQIRGQENHRWDLFCGISCAGTGVEQAFEMLRLDGYSLGINHMPNVIDTSRLNHPGHEFMCKAIQDVNPKAAFAGRKALFGWGSPSCKTYSVARGGVPVDKKDRAGPEEILDWMAETNVDHVIVENVVEFQTLTHLVPMRDKAGKFVFRHKVGNKATTDVPPQGNQSFEAWCKALSLLGYEVCLVQDKTRLGELFQAWLAEARDLGYEVDYRCLVAADYGDATTRKRLFVQFARKDAGVKVVWPKPTHCKPDAAGNLPPGIKRWRTARDIIDTSNLGKSIVDRKKPLAPKTLRRILIGFEKFVIYPLLNCAKPAEYFVTRQQGQSTAESVDAPVSTAMTGVKHGLASTFILPQQRGGAQVKSVDVPVSPVTCKGAESLCVVKYKGTSTVESLDQPLTTIQAQGRHHGVMTTNILKYYGTGTAVSAEDPLDTVTAKSRFGLQTTFVSTIDNRSNADGTTSGDAPISTITTKQRHAAVSCLVNTAHGPSGGESGRAKSTDTPLGAITASRDQAIVTYQVPQINGGGEVVLELNCLAPGGTGYPVLHVGDQAFEIDILFRMFTVRELAAAQGLPDDYKFSGNQTEAIAGIGNGVPVNLVRALTAAAVSQQPDIIQQLEASKNN